MSERTPLSNTIQAFSLIITMMAEELEATGSLSRRDFAKRLKDIADAAEHSAPKHLQGVDRLDLQIARKVARFLDSPNNSPVTPQSWTPVVIQGGRTE